MFDTFRFMPENTPFSQGFSRKSSLHLIPLKNKICIYNAKISGFTKKGIRLFILSRNLKFPTVGSPLGAVD